MVFSDPKFLFLLLPIALVAGLLTRRSALFSPVILALSLVFFYWTSGAYTLLLVASIVANWSFGLAIARWHRRAILVAAIVLNLGLLGFFKYLYFVLEPVGFLGSDDLFDFASGIVLPIGISFYTFQGLSYVIDVWRRDLPRAEPNLVLFAAYLAFFPHLVAGPIVRFGDVVADFHNPALSSEMFAAGAARFLVGLAKKVMIADLIAPIADAAFDGSGSDISFATAWIGSLAFTAQIYFDFSGYSDMAIGMFMMFGIRVPENFMHPYASRTITEFWRRWHISLSTWFRDYLYIPLGGNRLGTARTYLNLVVVFLATGIWHGAAWTFVLWGLYHGAFLVAERAILGHRAREVASLGLRLFYFLPVTVVGWVLFRATDVAGFVRHVGAMASPGADNAWALTPGVGAACTPLAIAALAAGLAAILLQGQYRPLGIFVSERPATATAAFGRLAFVIGAAFVASSFALTQGYSPFLYFRF